MTFAQRDRNYGRQCGGVAVFAESSVSSRVTVSAVSPAAERIWVLIHTDRDPYLVCSWYRPPDPGETTFADSFCSEFLEHSPMALGTLVVGDIN
eukprot:898726-Heterocapsa_arctica.AAC.1